MPEYFALPDERSLAYDRGAKLAAYAASGVREVWIVNLVDDVIESCRSLEAGQYQIVRPGESLSVAAFPDVAFCAAELLP